MDSTDSQSTSDSNEPQQKRPESISALFDRVEKVFQNFDYQPLNLETIVSELFHTPSHLDVFVTNEFLDDFVRFRLIETFDEEPSKVFNKLEWDQTPFIPNYKVWKLKVNA
jgi:hypothetical protein